MDGMRTDPPYTDVFPYGPTREAATPSRCASVRPRKPKPEFGVATITGALTSGAVGGHPAPVPKTVPTVREGSGIALCDPDGVRIRERLVAGQLRAFGTTDSALSGPSIASSLSTSAKNPGGSVSWRGAPNACVEGSADSACASFVPEKDAALISAIITKKAICVNGRS